MRYGGKEMGQAPALSGGIPGKLVGNTSLNFDTLEIHSIDGASTSTSDMSQIRQTTLPYQFPKPNGGYHLSLLRLVHSPPSKFSLLRVSRVTDIVLQFNIE